MSKVGDIHETLTAEGFAVTSVRSYRDGTVEVVADDRRTEAQARADELNAQWEPEEPEPGKSLLIEAATGSASARASLLAWKRRKERRHARVRAK